MGACASQACLLVERSVLIFFCMGVCPLSSCSRKLSRELCELCVFGQPGFPAFGWASFRHAGFVLAAAFAEPEACCCGFARRFQQQVFS